MDKRCTICTHPELEAISNAIIAGASLRDLAAQYGLSVSALSRHTKHIRRTLSVMADDDRQRQHHKLLEKLDLFEPRLERIFHQAQQRDSLHVSLGCVQEALRIFSLREKVRLNSPK